MVTIKCSAPSSLKLGAFTPFQGDLKKRTDKDIASLAGSIQNEGLLMPFAVWQHDSVNYILDGHGRMAALVELALHDPTIAEQEFPCITVDAATEDDARKALLQITSQYGKITKQGAIKFCASIPGYKAPSIDKFVRGPVIKRKVEQRSDAEQIVRLAVKSDKVDEFLQLMKQVSFVRIM